MNFASNKTSKIKFRNAKCTCDIIGRFRYGKRTKFSTKTVKNVAPIVKKKNEREKKKDVYSLFCKSD